MHASLLQDKQFYAGFKLDGVEAYKNLSGSPILRREEQFLVYLDPEYFPFEEEDRVRYFDSSNKFLYIEVDIFICLV